MKYKEVNGMIEWMEAMKAQIRIGACAKLHNTTGIDPF